MALRMAQNMNLSAALVMRRCQKTSSFQTVKRRYLGSESKGSTKKVANKIPENAKKEPSSWWTSAEVFGRLGAIAGWGMSGAAIYDASVSDPDIISMNMTGVLIVYSSLFARWAYVVKPQNLLLSACHVTNVGAQLNQLRRALEYKIEQGQKDEVEAYMYKIAAGAAGGAACILLGPGAQSAIVGANVGVVSSVAAAEAGPFTVHFWAPMSKWLISGASFMDLHRPTDKISIAQYTALTFTGLFFSRYSLLVAPINYTLCSVNIALFGSSAWHLGRKINADFIEKKE
mmetsp:Transcript_1653/g.1806  ORF Transcript_1653/g.1806 Transcript_1653/m.1806 type:complete len:287 (+) Transcript_1653:57-917(+)